METLSEHYECSILYRSVDRAESIRNPQQATNLYDASVCFGNCDMGLRPEYEFYRNSKIVGSLFIEFRTETLSEHYECSILFHSVVRTESI